MRVISAKRRHTTYEITLDSASARTLHQKTRQRWHEVDGWAVGYAEFSRAEVATIVDAITKHAGGAWHSASVIVGGEDGTLVWAGALSPSYRDKDVFVYSG